MKPVFVCSALYFALCLVFINLIETHIAISQTEIYLGPRESMAYPIKTTEKVRFFAQSNDNSNFTVFIYQKSSSGFAGRDFHMDCFNVVTCSVNNLRFGPEIDSPELINLSDEPQTIFVKISKTGNWRDDFHKIVTPLLVCWSLLLLVIM